MKTKGFSLVELAAVILILAIVAAAVTLRVGAPLRRAGMQGLVTQIVAFDHLTRAFAREQDKPLRLVVDLSAGKLRRTGDDGKEVGVPLEFPSGYIIERLRVGRQDVAGGRVALSCSSLGLAPTYALLLRAPDGQRRWILAAGLTGQAWEAHDESEVEAVFEALAPRPDAR